MKKRRSISMALLLAVCMLLGLLPSIQANAADSTVYVGGSGAGHYATLREAYDAVADGGTIILETTDRATEPYELNQGKTVTIAGTGTIQAQAGVFTTGSGSNNTLLYIKSGQVTIQSSINIDANKQCRAIGVAGSGTTLYLSGATVKNGNLTQSQQGAGIAVGKGATLIADNGAEISFNSGEANSSTSGGGLHVAEGGRATLGKVAFVNNEANSGGAIYTYKGTVTCTNETTFVGNIAEQRGGAIHCHGLVVLNGTAISGQHSNQYGGAVYVSASKGGGGEIGRLVLHNAAITGNTADNSGAGVFIADSGEAYVGGTTTVRIIDHNVEEYVSAFGALCKLGANQIDAAAENLLEIKRQIEEDPKGRSPAITDAVPA